VTNVMAMRKFGEGNPLVSKSSQSLEVRVFVIFGVRRYETRTEPTIRSYWVRQEVCWCSTVMYAIP
jgi:hypothetical protein